MEKIYLFDDRSINVVTGMNRVGHSPQLLSTLPYVDPAIHLVNLAWAYPFVYFNQELQRYVMFYQGWSINRSVIANTIQLAASSEDGITFEPLDMSPYFSGETQLLLNQVLPYQLEGFLFAEGQFFYLPHLKTPEKYVALCMYKGPGNLFRAVTFTSMDGLRYQFHPEMAWHQGMDTPDYPMSVVYNEQAAAYAIYRRPRHTDRRIALVMTSDFCQYTQAEVILQSDALDAPLTDFYGINTIHLDHLYLGFLMTYQTPNYLRFQGNRVSGLPGHKFDGGRVTTQLVYGENGKYFNRFLREDFFLHSNTLFQCIYPTCVIEQDENILLYASATPEEHGRVAPGKGVVVVFSLRKDGFSSLRSETGFGELILKPMLYQNGPLAFNVKCLVGSIKLQICDSDNVPISGYTYADCLPFTGDQISAEFSFQSASMDALAGRVIVLNLLSTGADLFSISGNFQPMTPYEAMKYENR